MKRVIKMKENKQIVNSLKPLLAKLIHNFLAGDYNQRRESAIAMSKFKGEKATDFLLETYESDNMQDFMALALGNIDSSKSAKLLIEALKDSNQEVRFNAARALGMMENPEAFDILMNALNNYIDSNLNSNNQNSIEEETQIFLEEDSIIGAIIALGKIKNWISISLLKRLYQQEKNARIRASVIMALGMMASDKLMPVFQSALRDEDPRVRANAIEAIEGIKSGSIVGIIQPYLEDPNNRVRANVAKAIWKYGDFYASDALTEMLQSNDKWYRASAAYAIGEINDPKFIKVLSKALKDEDSDVRRNAANAIRKIELSEAVPNLIPMLQDPNFDVRVEAVQAITRCAPDKAFELLTKHLPSEENFIVQATCISCLGLLKNDKAIPVISNYLGSEDSRVISNTIDALIKLCPKPDQSLIGRLKYLLSHDDNRVKSTAIKALWIWGEYSVLENLRGFFKSQDKKLIQSATFVLGEIGKEISLDATLANDINNVIAELIDNPDLINKLNQEESLPETTPAQTSTPPSPSKETAKPVTTTEKEKPDTKQIQEQRPATREAPKEYELPEGSMHQQSEPATNTVVISNEILPDNSYSAELTEAADLIADKEYEDAEEIFNKIHEAAPKHVKALLAHANMCFMLKRNNEAARYYKDALEVNPNIVKALFNLGTIYFYARKYETSLQYLVKALSIYPKILGAYLLLAQIYQIAGKYQDSVKLLTRAVELSPRNPVIYQKLAVLHMQLHQFDEAIVVLEKAIEISPASIESSVLLAYCFNYIGQPQRAFDSMDVALKICTQAASQENAVTQLLKGYVFTKTALSNYTN